ncbi:MAG: TolC family protein [Bacteroidota bacterium]|nr:TolC family protein [Bacteroidota bacterium]
MRNTFLVVCIMLMNSSFITAQTIKNISLQEAISIGLTVNPDILQAKQEIRSARGKMLQAGKMPNPEIGFSFNEIPSGYKVGLSNEKDISISQSFEYPTKRSNRISSASFDEQIAVAGVEQIKAKVSAGIKKAYINVQFAQITIRTIETQVSMFWDFQSLVTDKFKTGETKYLDVLRIEVETSRLQNELLEAKSNYFKMQSELKNGIGDSSSVFYSPKDSLKFIPVFADKDSLIELMTRQSNALVLNRLQIEKQESNLTLAQSSYYPDFGVGVAYQQRTPSSSFLGVELKVAVPLWFWQEPQGQVEEATAQLSIAELQLRSVERKIRNNLNSAFTNVQSTEQQVKNYEQILNKGVKDIMSVALSQYRNNQLDLLNLFDVYRAYRTTQAEYFRSVANYQHALVEFEIAAELSIE